MKPLDYYRQKYCTSQEATGAILCDLDNKQRERPWRAKKMLCEALADIYEKINPAKALRLRECGRVLSFRVYADGSKKLDSMTSCHVRLCPLCNWRRSLKMWSNIRQIIDFVQQEKNYRYILLTLTVRNCTAGGLNETVDNMMSAWNRFVGYTEIKRAVNGWYRCLEITHNVNRESKDFNTYHPHFHCLLCVNPSYFTSRDYISVEKMSYLWAKAARLDYVPVIDMRKVHPDSSGSISGALAEVCKYTVKGSDYFIMDDALLTLDTVRTLDYVLANRRLVAYGGNLKAVRKLLQLGDEVDGNLVDVGDVCEKEGEDYYIETYYWYSGYRQYVSIDYE